MTKQNKIHRVFLIFLFVVCAVAVIFLIKEKTDAASALTTNLSSGIQTSWEEVQPTATTTLQASNPEIQKTTALAQQDLEEKTVAAVNSIPTSTTTISTTTTPTTTPTKTTTSWSEVQPTATTTTVAEQNDNSLETENATTATRQTSVSVKEETRERTSENTAVKVEASREAQQNPAVQQQIVSVEPLAVEPAFENKVIENKSEVISAPIVVEAKNIAKESNPKVSGKVDNSLKIDTVSMNKKDETKNSVALSGKAQPNSIVTIYIFSTDPVVIKVKTDANGNWNYELDKELANGQHEAFVAVTDDSGKIISKSEPIAFVKTAQAASIIPMSEFTGNESPIEKSSQQFILMAIIIMSICLLIALVLIGFLSHKRNLNERIN